MIIDFKIRRTTAEGEKVYITGSSPLVGNYSIDKAAELEKEESCWSITLKVDPFKERIFSYKYFTKNSAGELSFEAGGGRRIALNSNTQHITTLDEWQKNDEKAPFLTDPFAHVFYGANYSPYTQTHRRANEIIIRAVVPNVPSCSHLVLVGNCPELGNWNPSKGLRMARLKGLKWIASIDSSKYAGKALEYAFAIADNANKTESGSTTKHHIEVPQLLKHETLIVEHSNISFDFETPKFAGVTVPLSALRTNSSCGIGEIADLKLLVDWACKTGMKIINILPINDTTRYFNSKDSSPYNSISSIALNPIYLSIDALPRPKSTRRYEEAQEERRSLNRRASIDYEDVYAFKSKYFREIYDENKEELTSHPDYYKFIKSNKEWIYSYALFCALRDHFKSANFRLWSSFAKYSQPLVDQMSSSVFNYSLNQAYNIDMKPIYESVRYYVYLQFLLFNQMKEVIDYAHSKGIAIAGELPMNVSPEGVDAWKMPYLFNFQGDANKDKKENLSKIQSIIKSSQTGASAPVYNWQAMEEEKFLWWIMRMRSIHSIYDIISLGRIGEQSGIADNKEFAKMLPQLVASSNMLVCGKYSHSNKKLAIESETVIKSERIKDCLQALRVLSLELPMEESFEGNYYSVVASSTCNSPTLRMWLGEAMGTVSYTSDDDGTQYFDATAEECSEVLRSNLSSKSMLALFPLQDWLSINGKARNRFPYSERTNNPNTSGWTWKYRLHCTLEQLLENETLTSQIISLVKESGRISLNLE